MKFMHDPTEGGFMGGTARLPFSGLEAKIDYSSVPVHPYRKSLGEA